MAFTGDVCDICHHEWDFHLHERYKFETERVTKKNEEIEKMIKENRSNEEVINKVIKVLNEEV